MEISTEATVTYLEMKDDDKEDKMDYGDKEELINDEKKTRRIHIDILIISLVYAKFLANILKIYSITETAVLKHPSNNHSGFSEDFLVNEDKYLVIPTDHWNWLILQTGWRYLYPLFYFLCGWNSFSSLTKRTEREFRDERVHRLLIPVMTVCILQMFQTVAHFAPLDPVCQQHYDGNKTAGGTWKPLEDPNNLCKMDFLFAFWFSVNHPNINTEEEAHIPYCGSTCCPCSKKPFSWISKLCCCLHFLGKPTSNPTDFQTAVAFYLGGPVRLIIVPGILILVLEVPDIILGLFGTVSLDLDHMAFYFFGYVLAASEFGDLGDICRKHRWIYLVCGLVLCVCDSVLILCEFDLNNKKMIENVDFSVALAVFKCFGAWMFILGIVNIAKETFSTPNPLVSKLREIAMPFYLTHFTVLVLYLAGAFWVPYFRSFPITVLCGTVLTGVVSYLITKGRFLRYFFGLGGPNSVLPGKAMRGFVPAIIMAIVIISSNVVIYVGYNL